MNKLNRFFLLLRVSQWTKAVFVMLGFVYTPASGYLVPALLASLAFCLIASAVYIYNDIHDRFEDRLHPLKQNRPIASELVSLTDALLMMSVLLVTGLTLGWLISKMLAYILICYLLINLLYNHYLKRVPLLDVLCIASGFMLRVLAGTVGIGLSISIWLIVAATLLSLFIALNKRRLEMNMGIVSVTREALLSYSPFLLDHLIKLIGILCFITYFLYIVYSRNESFHFILTLPFAAIALWRFAWLSHQEVTNDDPVTIFISDRLSRINLWCFAILTFMALTK